MRCAYDGTCIYKDDYLKIFILGIGAKKLFRDLVYEHRGIRNADYEYYKSKGLLDFPNRNYSKIFISKLLQTIRMQNDSKYKENKNISPLTY